MCVHPHEYGWFTVKPTRELLGATVIRHLAANTPTGVPALRLIDSTPVPCGASRETAKRCDLAGDAGYGYCASHSRYFWGMHLYLVTTVEGMPVSWCLATRNSTNAR